MGSRVSILSGKELHILGDDGMWPPYSAERFSQVKSDNRFSAAVCSQRQPYPGCR